MAEGETTGADAVDEQVPEQEIRSEQVVFKILGGAQLQFDYQLQRDNTCIADTSPGVDIAEQAGIIEIIERVPPNKRKDFSGRPEPVMNGNLKFSQITQGLNGAEIEVKNFGEWVCRRCDHINYIPPENGRIAEPFECDNDVCGRKGPFKRMFPIDLIKPIWKLPIEPVASSNTEVYTEVHDFCKKYLVLKEEEYHLLTCWTLASWLVDDFTTCPYLCMIAPKSSGKTKVLEVLGELAYRAVSAISVTPPSLFRSIELWHITLLIDEAEYQIKQDTEAGQALYGCLNGGYKKGSYALRIEGDGANRIPAAFDVFGFKAISSTRLFHPTLESRSIIINMTQGVPQKILIDTTEAAVIRSKLLYWRYATLGKLPLVLPDSSSGRLIEMFIPLFTIAQILKGTEGIKKPISYDDLVKLLVSTLRDMESVRKEEEYQSKEAQVLEALTVLEQRCKEGYTDEIDYIFLKEIAGQLGWDTTPRTLAEIGKLLRVMGIKMTRKNRGTIIHVWERETQEKLKSLKARYLVA